MSTPEKLYVRWQNIAEESRQWHNIGVLQHVPDQGYFFRYVEGARQAREAGFTSIASFPELTKAYHSPKLPAFFANRIMSKSRPDYAEHMAQLDLDPNKNHSEPAYVFEYLARSEGRRATDAFETYAPPTIEEGMLRWSFFTKGVRHLHDKLVELWAQGVDPDLPLRLVPDPQNEFDPYAVLVMDRSQSALGFIPRTCSKLVHTAAQQAPQGEVHVRLLRHNPAPVATHHQRFLVGIECPISEDFDTEEPDDLAAIVPLPQPQHG